MLARKALAGTAGAPKEYVEDVFSTYLYTGTGSNQTITNNIDISGEGGLVWIKGRNFASSHWLADTERGNTKYIRSNTTNANLTYTDLITSFNNNGFTLGTDSSGDVNTSPNTHASWTFRKAKKFFDVVTYTGNGTTKTVSHNLGSTPGCVIVKSTSGAGTAWYVWHRSLSAGYYAFLNTTAAQSNSNSAISFGNNTTYVDPTSTNFTVGSNGDMNDNGATYVAYLFAHDAGGFGDAGSDSIIKCGSYTGNGSSTGPTVTLDWEPQWLLVKNATSIRNWFLVDNMRGLTVGGVDPVLQPNSSSAELSSSGYDYFSPNATGFSITNSDADVNANGSTYIYIAIRRGPMKTPTSGTSVFTPKTRTGTGSATTVTGISANVVDVVFTEPRVNGSGDQRTVWDRMRGASNYLVTTGTGAEANYTSGLSGFDVMNGYKYGSGDTLVNSAQTYVDFVFTRAPGFFDVVCYTGDGVNGRAINHNLTVSPELIFIKARVSNGGAGYWNVWVSSESSKGNLLNNGNFDAGYNRVTATSSTTFTVTDSVISNYNTSTYVAYLFASVSGVSKVGTYTGNGSSVTVTTDFQPRFILVKRTDSTGDWLVSDSARGLVAGNDPYLELNTTDAEVTNEDWVDISSTSFTVNQTTNNANVNTGTYIYLAIA